MNEKGRPLLKSRIINGLFVFGAVLLGFFSITLILTARSTHQDYFNSAYSALIKGDYLACSRGFSDLSSSAWVGQEAKVGESICRNLSGDAYVLPIADRDALESLEQFPIRQLLQTALSSKNYQGCLDLAEFAITADLGEASLYKAAALLELGYRDQSQDLFNSLSHENRTGPLGIRLKRVLTALADDASAVLQDRRGQPLGWVTSDNRLQLLDGVDSSLLPLDTIQKALDKNPASSVRLSIDLELSRIAKRALRGYRGSIVLLEPETGEILAAVSDKYTRRRLSDPAFNEMLEPASISKLITTTATLRAHIDADDEISRMRCRGALRLGEEYIWCPRPAGRLRGLNHALGSSCNVAFAKLGLMLGAKRLLDELHHYGFDRPHSQGLQLGTILRKPANQKQLADLSIGLEYSLSSTLHGAVIASVFANGGYRVDPTLFSARDGLLGISSQGLLKPNRKRILHPDWIASLRKSMCAVVNWGGTAHGIVPENFPVAMKTGTAATPGKGYHTNYIGFGPVEKAKIAFCVRITRIRSSKVAGQASRGATGRLLRYLGQNPDLLEKRPGSEYLQWTAAFEMLDEQ